MMDKANRADKGAGRHINHQRPRIGEIDHICVAGDGKTRVGLYISRIIESIPVGRTIKIIVQLTVSYNYISYYSNVMMDIHIGVETLFIRE